MDNLFNFISNEKIRMIFSYGWKPLVEVPIIAVFVYYIVRFVRGTRAAYVLKGLFIVIVGFFIAQKFQLHTINWLLTKVFAFSVIAFLIIFQPDLRRALAKLGQNTLFGGLIREETFITGISKAAGILSRKRIGALIVIEQGIGLKNYIESGIQIDSQLTTELLVTMFMPTTPLHDGALIIQGERIAAAGCLLPLTTMPSVSKTLGTRHRAAMGVTEESDAITIVVSEKTGTISLVKAGKITRDLDSEALRNQLSKIILKPKTQKSR